MNLYHAIPDDIKHFQQAELRHYVIQTGNLKFSSGNYISPVDFFLISSPARSIPYQLKSGNTKSHYNNEKNKEGTQIFYFYVLVTPIISILRIENRL